VHTPVQEIDCEFYARPVQYPGTISAEAQCCVSALTSATPIRDYLTILVSATSLLARRETISNSNSISVVRPIGIVIALYANLTVARDIVLITASIRRQRKNVLTWTICAFQTTPRDAAARPT
jgi:hypothetical protein